MYSKTRFGQLLDGLPRGAFNRLVEKHKTNKFSKGFKSWDQLVAMVYSQLSHCKSLRELEVSFNAQNLHHYHLGTRTIKRSTLSEANTKRTSELFADMCNLLINSAHRKAKRELKEMLYLMDSSPIPLKGLGFDDWASSLRNNLCQGLKIHLMIEGTSATPSYMNITGAQVSDIKAGRNIPLETNATYVFDKGYYDFNWWFKIEEIGSRFVTRTKKNAKFIVEELCDIPEEDDHIIEDAYIQFKNRRVSGNAVINNYYQKRLRRITAHRPDKTTPIVLITNDFDRSASEIAALYKKRWDIELFFKWLKQNLKLKSFLGRSENAVKTQIYTAIISYLLLQIYHKKQDIKNSLKLCLSVIRVGLFQRVEIDQELRKRELSRRIQITNIQPELAF